MLTTVCVYNIILINCISGHRTGRYIDQCAICRFGRNIAIKSGYYVSDIKLQKVHTIKDLGVTFDEQLKFSDHCYDKIKKAY